MMFKKTLSLHLEKRKKLFREKWFLPLLQKRNVIRNLFNKVLISVQRKGYTKDQPITFNTCLWKKQNEQMTASYRETPI